MLERLTDREVGEKILRLVLDPLMEERLKMANDKLDELTAVHKDHPMTTNNRFMDNIKKGRQKSTQEGLAERLHKELSTLGRTVDSNVVEYIFASVLDSKANPDMDMVAAEDAFDNMNAYYQVSMCR